MAGNEREQTGDLTRLTALQENPERFHIYQALRLIEAAYADRPRLGRSRRPREDAVRLKQKVSMAFAPSTLTSYRPTPDGRAELSQLMFGLFGPNGPLPLHLTQYAHERQHQHRDRTLAAFADIFHHRMISLLYRAWASGEPAPSFDREGEDDTFAQIVAALAGLRGKAFANRDAMPDLAKLRYSGRLAHVTRNEEGLVSLVSGFFGARAELISFVGTWLHLDPKDRWQLGNTRQPARLGQTCSLGSRVWSRQAKFRFRVGPVDMKTYVRLLPSGDSLRRLVALVRNFVGDTFEWDVNLVLDRGQAPPLKLGQSGRLGWTTWLGTPSPDRDLDDLFIQPQP